MLRPRFRRAASLLVLAAMAYGLGAPDCGCWEHSGWRAALVALADDPTDRAREDAAVVDAIDCEHERETLATVGPRCEPIAAGGGFAPPASHAAPTLSANGIWFPGALAGTAMAEPAGTALPVCASLQVLRL